MMIKKLTGKYSYKGKGQSAIPIVLFYLLVIISLYFMNLGMLRFQTYGFLMVLLLASIQRPLTIFLFMISLLPLQEILRFENSSITLMPYITIIFFIKLLIRPIRISLEGIVPIIILSIISIFVSLTKWQTITSTLVFIFVLMIPLFVVQIGKEIRPLSKMIPWLFISSMVISIIFSRYFTNATQIINYKYEGFYRSTGFSNPWSYGVNALIAAAFTITLLMNENVGGKKIIYIALSFFFIFIAVLSGTYSTLLGIILVVYHMVKSLSKRKKILFLFIMPLGAILLGVVFLGFINVRGRSITDNSRISIWTAYIIDLVNNPINIFIGVGGGNIEKYSNDLGILTAHNGFLELFLEVGFIGIVIIYIYYKVLSKNIKVSIKANIFWLPICCYFLFLLTQGGFSSYTMMLLFSLALVTSKENLHSYQYIDKTH